MRFDEGILLLIVFIVFFSCIIKRDIIDKRKNKKKKDINKNYHNPQNNYFKNSPDHTDVTHEYIESIWEEMNK